MTHEGNKPLILLIFIGFKDLSTLASVTKDGDALES